MFGWWQRRRRNRIRAREFPAAWRAVVQRNVPLFGRLSAADQAELLGHILVFLDEKRFEGAGGLEITDEIRVTIAAQACVLLLHRADDYFPELVTVIVYPATFVTPHKTVENGLVTEGHAVTLGQSWTRGNVVLAWDAALGGGRDLRDGHNVVLHEFAHQLDQETGSANGAPRLGSRAAHARWADVMAREFAGLQARIRARDAARARAQAEWSWFGPSPDRHTGAEPADLISDYGATNEAEFFAVVTEVFFEQPAALADRHPDLFALLRDYYAVDPREWH